MSRLLSRVRRRLAGAVRSPPSRREFGNLAGTLAVFGLVAVPFGLVTGLFEFTRPSDAVGTLLAYAFVSFLFPATAEELVFRGLLLPRRDESVSPRSRALALAVALGLFVAWHPLNAWLFLPWTRPLFFRVDFLVVAGLLGIGATYLHQTSRSLWPAILFHWIAVVVWKLVLGGRVITFGPPV